jgi:hypothetical protein
MKYFIYILIALAAILLVFNITQLDFDHLFDGESTVAAICVMASACTIVLLIILLVSTKIDKKR